MRSSKPSHELFFHESFGYHGSIYVLWCSWVESPTGLIVEITKPGTKPHTVRVKHGFDSTSLAVKEGRYIVERHALIESERNSLH